MIERGFVYRGLKPVYWCFDCGSSLAEFEIEYADKKSDTLDVAFLCAQPDKLARLLVCPSWTKKLLRSFGPPRRGPFPPTKRLNLNPELIYALVDTDKGLYMCAESLVDKCLERWQLSGNVVATCLGPSAGPD